MMHSHRITIINIRTPANKNINQELQWLGSSLGLFNLRDRDKSCYRLFIEIVKTTKENKALTSDELADRLSLSRGTVVHHLHKLLDSGIVVQARKGYILRVHNLQDLIDEMEKDIARTVLDLKKMAEEIDKEIGLG